MSKNINKAKLWIFNVKRAEISNMNRNTNLFVTMLFYVWLNITRFTIVIYLF